jgi:hypothetical protein
MQVLVAQISAESKSRYSLECRKNTPVVRQLMSWSLMQSAGACSCSVSLYLHGARQMLMDRVKREAGSRLALTTSNLNIKYLGQCQAGRLRAQLHVPFFC